MPLTESFFAFDEDTNVFSIDTKDTGLSGLYKKKVIARFEHTYPQVTEFEFDVALIFYCEFSTVSNPGQASFTTPQNYKYHGSAIFEINPFIVDPPECTVIYSCNIISGTSNEDLCNYKGSLTTADLNIISGSYLLTTRDFPTFGVQTFTFEITGSTHSSSAKFTFSLTF